MTSPGHRPTRGAGLPYYPKWTSSVPFTPATGPKLLVEPTLDAAQKAVVRTALFAAARQLAEELEVSSSHALFLPPSQVSLYSDFGFFIRHSFQFHWQNRGYANFAEFLAALRSKRRKEIERERSQAAQVKISRLTGAQIQPEHARLFYGFYLSTIDKMNSFAYLTEAFFEYVFTHMKDVILLVVATRGDGEAVAGALNYFGPKTLFGRHWGCLVDYRALHFEVCYYQGLEFAIERQMHTFEAGAQGEHKLSRGFLPTLTYSAHQIHHPGFAGAIQNFVATEKLQLVDLFAEYMNHSPYRA